MRPSLHGPWLAAQPLVPSEPSKTCCVPNSRSTLLWRKPQRCDEDLLGKLEAALAAAVATMQPMGPRTLAEKVAVPWREEDRRFGGSRVVLETHVLPVGQVERLRATSLRELPTRLARAGRDHGLYPEGQALSLETSEQTAVAETDRGDRAVSRVAISAGRSLTVWSALPTQQLGAVYDEAQVAGQIARDVRLAASLALVATEDAAIAVGIGPIDMLGRVTGPNSMTFPFMGSGRGAARLEPTEVYAAASLSRIAVEIGEELAARLTLRLEQRPS